MFQTKFTVGLPQKLNWSHQEGGEDSELKRL